MKLLIMRGCIGVFLVFSLIMVSCSENEQVMPDLGYEYYPLRVGNYSIYDVQENKESYELKVTITDSVIYEPGVVTYILLREKRKSTSEEWQSLNTWSTKVINNKVLQNEGNVLFVKLLFPPSLNLMWDGNQYNNLEVVENPFSISLPYDGNVLTDNASDQYFISEQNVPITLPTGFKAENTITVIHNDFQDNVVGTDQRKEIYAKGVGLIYKEITQFIKCNGTICSGDKSGILSQSLKAYGKI